MIRLKKLLLEKGKGMWANIHAKRKRGEAPAKPGDPDRPSKKNWDANKESTDEVIEESEYQGRKVALNFGAKGMVIKKDNPGARKSFRARFNCDTPGPKWKARYWSCKKW